MALHIDLMNCGATDAEILPYAIRARDSPRLPMELPQSEPIGWGLPVVIYRTTEEQGEEKSAPGEVKNSANLLNLQ
jgi:hypothetical protein